MVASMAAAVKMNLFMYQSGVSFGLIVVYLHKLTEKILTLEVTPCQIKI
jgi:hypothetical protein